jgi:hypothetical protein
MCSIYTFQKLTYIQLKLESIGLKKEVGMMKTLSSALILSFGIMFASAAFAQVPKGTVRLNLDSNLVHFNVGGWNPAGVEDWRMKRLDAGIGNPNVGLGLGVTLADALAIGLKFSIAYQSGEASFDADDSGILEEESTTDFETTKYSFLRWGVAPYLEYAFLEKVVRPFIMVTLGFEGQKEDNYYATTAYWDFLLGLGGGLHIFANPSVSIDLTILLGFSAGGGAVAARDREVYPNPL